MAILEAADLREVGGASEAGIIITTPFIKKVLKRQQRPSRRTLRPLQYL